MKTLSFNLNENEELVINKMVIDQIYKPEIFIDHVTPIENYKYYGLNIKGRDKLTKFWEQVLKQATKTNFGGHLYEQFSYATIVTEDYEITFNCPKNYCPYTYYIVIDLKIK